MPNCDNIEKSFCWYGDDKALKECIKRSKYVTKVRTELMKKKMKENFPN